MKTEINIEDYISDSEIKEIATDILKAKINKDAERILNNMAYHLVFKAVDEALDNEAKALIKDKAKSIIKNLNSFEVFRKKDAWEKDESIAWAELQKAMEKNKSLIHEKVHQAIKNYDYESELRNNEDYVVDVFINALSKGLKKEEL